jgi:hypothetical protein
MLTGAPTCNVLHLKPRDDKKNVTNSSRIELHHHSSTMHKGLLQTFHKTSLRLHLLKYYKRVTKYAYAMCDVPQFLLPSTFLSQAHFSVFVVTTLSYCTHITLQSIVQFCFHVVFLLVVIIKGIFLFYLYLNLMPVSCGVLIFTILQAHSYVYSHYCIN